MSAPIDSAVLSMALAVTSKSARSLSCLRPEAKGVSLPTAASMRRTPGEKSVFIDVELNVGGELSLIALRTEIVGALDPCPSYSRQYRAGTHSYILGRMTAVAGQASMVTVRWLKSQQLGDGIGAGLMDRGSNRCLHGLQIQPAGAMPIGKDSLELVL